MSEKEIQSLTIEKRTARPPGCPKGITVDQLQCLFPTQEEKNEKFKREERCEQLLCELHWWRSPPDEWPSYKNECRRLETKAFPQLAQFLSAFQWVGFQYEVEARKNAEERGTIEWASGKPFAHLNLAEIFYEAQLRGGYDSMIRKSVTDGQSDPLGVWSDNFQVNLEFPNRALVAAFRKHIAQQKKSHGIDQRRKAIPWDGLEAFDRRLAKLSHLSGNDPQLIKRAFEAYEARSPQSDSA